MATQREDTVTAATSAIDSESIADISNITFPVPLDMQETFSYEQRQYTSHHQQYKDIAIPISRIIQIPTPWVHFDSKQSVPTVSNMS
jgi:hypothetical protein